MGKQTMQSASSKINDENEAFRENYLNNNNNIQISKAP